MEKLFAYGSLTDEEVQETVFGRTLEGIPETLQKFVVKEIKIEEEYGIESYAIISATQNKEDSISGNLYEITLRELELADTYEGKHYKRIEVLLNSDQMAWVYTATT
jgi:gamma-glutamylcyclotransferase (GGCT)/AIG2-like uncharacterized protein YtfP